MRSRRAPLLTALLLIGALLGGNTSASALPRVDYGSISGVVTDAAAACVPFDNSHLVGVEAWDAALERTSVFISDGTGIYSIKDLSPGDYKMRFRVVDPTNQFAAYWWYGGSTTYESGSTVAVTSGQATLISPCLPGFDGGTFKGSVVSTAPGFDSSCVTVMAYEAGSRIRVGMTNPVSAAGRYRHFPDIPAGKYTALAFMSTDPTCLPSLTLDQWWKGHSGADFMAAANATLASSGAVFVIGTGGAVTKAIHFDLVPIGTCDGKVPTILGTTADDVITGTAGPDVIMLYHGDDEAHGGNGKDAICGGKGDDNLYGDEMNDRIFGNQHDDYMTGGDGYDLIEGGRGVDQILGGPGKDKLRGWAGDDLIHGDDDDDTVIVNKGDDTLRGGPGNDNGDGGTGTNTCDVFVENLVNC